MLAPELKAIVIKSACVRTVAMQLHPARELSTGSHAPNAVQHAESSLDPHAAKEVEPQQAQ
jgi:hypothetical protein